MTTETKEWKAGDRVQWTRRTLRGRSIEVKRMDGVVEGPDVLENVLEVRMLNGRKARVHTSRLRSADQPSDLTLAFEAYAREQAGGKGGAA